MSGGVVLTANTQHFNSEACRAAELLASFNGKSDEDIQDLLSKLQNSRRGFGETIIKYYSEYLDKNNAPLTDNSELNNQVSEAQIIKGLTELLKRTRGEAQDSGGVSERTVRNWLDRTDMTLSSQKNKIAFFLFAFAIGLSAAETSAMFQRLFGIPCFTRRRTDYIFEYCFVNNKSYADAIEMLRDYENQTAELYESAFNAAYREPTEEDKRFYISALNCDCDCLALIAYLAEKASDNAELLSLLENSSLSAYLKTLIAAYEEKNPALTSKAMDNAARSLFSQGIRNKYVNNKSGDNFRIKAWREGERDEAKLIGSFSDRAHLYALAYVMKLSEKEFSGIVLLSAKQRAQKLIKTSDGGDALSVIREYIRRKKDISLPIACEEDIAVYNALFAGRANNADEIKKHKLVYTRGENSLESNFECESRAFIEQMISLRKEFTSENERARQTVQKLLNSKIIKEALLKHILSIIEKIDDKTKPLCKRAFKEYFASQNETEESKWLLKWFWVSFFYDASDNKILTEIFEAAINNAKQELKEKPWFRRDTSNSEFKRYILSNNLGIDKFYNGSPIFEPESREWVSFNEEYLDAYTVAENKELVYYNIINIKKTVFKKAFIDYCGKEAERIYKTDVKGRLEEIKNDESTADWRRFLCDAFGSIPAPSLAESDEFTVGKGNMFFKFEQLRCLLILLHFYRYFIGKGSGEDYPAKANAMLAECGFGNLYAQDPFDFVIVMCSQTEDPIRYISFLRKAALSGNFEAGF